MKDLQETYSWEAFQKLKISLLNRKTQTKDQAALRIENIRPVPV